MGEPLTVWHAVTDTPIGELLLVASEAGLERIEFEGRDRIRPASGQPDPERLKPAIDQLLEYFAGERRQFDLRLAPRGTPFQLAVWNALLEIGYGQTRCYADIARTIGRPAAVRAVGAANGANPIPVVIPCHRVIGKGGSLTGFGGGLDMKRRLLDLEAGHRLL